MCADAGWTAGGQSSLQIAARVGRDDIVALLVNYKAEVDSRNANGKTALHWASQSGHLAAVHVLLKCGADVAAVDGVSPFSEQYHVVYGELCIDVLGSMQ